jgi:parvulin-like peptidyl-prolyl isomerase
LPNHFSGPAEKPNPHFTKESRMKKALGRSLAALALVNLLLFASPAKAKILASAGEEKITSAEFDQKVKESEAKQGKALDKAGKQGLLKELLNQRLLVSEARAKGLDKDKQVKQAILDGTRQVLANTLFDREITSKTKVGEDEVKDFYKNNPAALELARVSDILIRITPGRKDEEAKKTAAGIYRAVKGNPAKFAETARKESEDTVSRERGGDLGAFGRGNMVPEIDKAVFEAKPGDFLAPVRTQGGYHVIYVVKKRVPSLEESSAAITQELSRRKIAAGMQQYLEKLSKKYKAKVSEDAIP